MDTTDARTKKEHRVLAKFVPQSPWETYPDQYYDLEDRAYFFDITDFVRTTPIPQLLEIQDDSYESDALWQEHEVRQENPWYGMFKVLLYDAIRKYDEDVLNDTTIDPEVAVALRALRPSWEGTFNEIFTTAAELVRPLGGKPTSSES